MQLRVMHQILWKGWCCHSNILDSATNLVTGIADAQIDSTPMVYMGQVASYLLSSDTFKETDIDISTVTRPGTARLPASEISGIVSKLSL